LEIAVVEEGHRLKSSHYKLLRELKTLPAENKLLLTGTPLQNNLAELWSLLNFILPQIFTSCEEFESWFDLAGKQINEMKQKEIEEKRRIQVISKLHLILRPFLLKKLNEKVEQSLLGRKEIILYANMTEEQKQIQDHLVNKTLEVYLEFDQSFEYPPVEQLVKQCGMLNDSAENASANVDTLPLKGPACANVDTLTLKGPGWKVAVRSGQGGSMLFSIEG